MQSVVPVLLFSAPGGLPGADVAAGWSTVVAGAGGGRAADCDGAIACAAAVFDLVGGGFTGTCRLVCCGGPAGGLASFRRSSVRARGVGREAATGGGRAGVEVPIG